MDKIQCFGIALTAEQEKHLVTLVAGSPDILGINVYPNLDITNPDDVPSGIVMYFPPSAQVDTTLISANLFQSVMVAKVHAGPHTTQLSDGTFTGNLDLISGAVEQHPVDAACNACRHVSNRDKKVWTSELGGRDSFVGAYYQNRNNHREKDYFIVARGTSPKTVHDLQRSIAASAVPVKYRDLVCGDEWSSRFRNAANMAHRNLQRNISNVAEAYNVGVLRIDDIGAFLQEPHHAPPECAVPGWEQNTYSIRSTMFKGRPAVAMYNGVVPKEDCQMLKGGKFFVIANPYDGIHVFPITEATTSTSVAADTGRSATKPALDIDATKTRSEGATWEQKTQTPVHEDLAPGAFNTLTPALKESMKQVGWNAENHIGVMIPLAIKIFNPEINV